MKVDFTIPEVDVRAECECGHVCWGDSAVDAFTNWWAHKAEAHRETPEPEIPENPGPVVPVGDPGFPGGN